MNGNSQPANYADVRIINGEQGSGKSTIGVGFAVGDYHAQMEGLMSPNGSTIAAKSLTKADKVALIQERVYPSPFKYCRVFSEDAAHSKVIRIPSNYLVLSPVKIFANFTMYGVRYAPISLFDLIQYMNTDLFNNSWILSDESVMTDARNSMENAGKLSAGFGATIRKRNAHMCLMVQYTEQLERRYRLFHTMEVICSYDNARHRVNIDIKKRGEPSVSTDIDAKQYWPYFDTNELIKVPQYKIDKTLAKMVEANA
jgi:hypothetical protein